MAILDELLQPMTNREFRAEYLFRKPFAAADRAAQFRKLISWPLLADIFATGYGDCWLPKAGRLPKEPERATGRLALDQAMRAFGDGRSILVRHSERAHGRLKEIAEDFQRVFSDPIDIQLYATPAGEEGFDWHYDIEEVFVIQSSGEKEFRLRIPRTPPSLEKVELPKTIDFGREFLPGEIRCHLKAGDWLYIPAGVWHKARALTPSFHLSVGVMSSERRALVKAESEQRRLQPSL